MIDEINPKGTMKALHQANARVDALEAERDALAAHVEAIGDYMKDQWPGAYAKVFERFGGVAPATSLARRDDLESERDALAAHMERLQKDSDWLCYCLAHDYTRLKKTSDEAFSTLQNTLIAKPATSIASMKAQWQAEALEEAAERLALAQYADTVRNHLRTKADKLRRQAEEAPDGK